MCTGVSQSTGEQERPEIGPEMKTFGDFCAFLWLAPFAGIEFPLVVKSYVTGPATL